MSAEISHQVQLTLDQIDALGTAYRAKLSELKTCVILGPQEIGQQEYIEFTQMYKEETHAELDRLLSKFRPVEMLDRAKVASVRMYGTRAESWTRACSPNMETNKPIGGNSGEIDPPCVE